MSFAPEYDNDVDVADQLRVNEFGFPCVISTPTSLSVCPDRSLMASPGLVPPEEAGRGVGGQSVRPAGQEVGHGRAACELVVGRV